MKPEACTSHWHCDPTTAAHDCVADRTRPCSDCGANPKPEVTAADLTDEEILAYFEEHCECRPTDVNRRSHSHDCDDGACEDARVALGGYPDGPWGPRPTATAIIQRNAARQIVAAAINARRRQP